MDSKVYELAKQARALLAAEYDGLGIEPQAARLMAQGHQPGGVHYAAVKAIIAALTPPEGYVLAPNADLTQVALVAATLRSDLDRGCLALNRSALVGVLSRLERALGRSTVDDAYSAAIDLFPGCAAQRGAFMAGYTHALRAARPEVP